MEDNNYNIKNNIYIESKLSEKKFKKNVKKNKKKIICKKNNMIDKFLINQKKNLLLKILPWENLYTESNFNNFMLSDQHIETLNNTYKINKLFFYNLFKNYELIGISKDVSDYFLNLYFKDYINEKEKKKNSSISISSNDSYILNETDDNNNIEIDIVDDDDNNNDNDNDDNDDDNDDDNYENNENNEDNENDNILKISLNDYPIISKLEESDNKNFNKEDEKNEENEKDNFNNDVYIDKKNDNPTIINKNIKNNKNRLISSELEFNSQMDSNIMKININKLKKSFNNENIEETREKIINKKNILQNFFSDNTYINKKLELLRYMKLNNIECFNTYDFDVEDKNGEKIISNEDINNWYESFKNIEHRKKNIFNPSIILISASLFGIEYLSKYFNIKEFEGISKNFSEQTIPQDLMTTKEYLDEHISKHIPKNPVFDFCIYLLKTFFEKKLSL